MKDYLILHCHSRHRISKVILLIEIPLVFSVFIAVVNAHIIAQKRNNPVYLAKKEVFPQVPVDYK
jgi:hypothetical protein